MSFAGQTKPAAPKFADIEILPPGSVRMCPQPVELISPDINDAPLRQKPVRVRWIVEGLLPEFSIRGYCRLCLGSGSTARAARAPGTGASRRGGDGRDDGSRGDDGGSDPPPPPSRPTGCLFRFPLRAVPVVLVCRERGGEGWLTLSGSNGWLFGSRDEAHREALWLAHNRGSLPVRELVGGTR